MCVNEEGCGRGGVKCTGTVILRIPPYPPLKKHHTPNQTQPNQTQNSAGDVDIYQQTHESLKALLADAAAKEMASLQPGAGARKRPASAVAGAGGGGGGGGVKWEYRGPDGQVGGFWVGLGWVGC